MGQPDKDALRSAATCRILAATSLTEDAREILAEMAANFERLADRQTMLQANKSKATERAY